jgi:hypothetical protein
MPSRRFAATGERVLAVFSDPDCPYCQRLESELEKLDNVTVYTFAYPLESLHPGQGQGGGGLVRARSRARLGRADADRQGTAQAYVRAPDRAQHRTRAASGHPGHADAAVRRRAPAARVPRAASASSNGWRRAGHEAGRGFSAARSRSRPSPDALARCRGSTVKADSRARRRTGSPVPRSPGSTRTRCRTTCRVRPDRRRRREERARNPPPRPMRARAQLRRTDPQRAEGPARMARAVGRRRRGAARPVVPLSGRRSRSLAGRARARQAGEGYRPVLPPRALRPRCRESGERPALRLERATPANGPLPATPMPGRDLLPPAGEGEP